MGNELKLIFVSFIVLLLGVIFLGVLADNISDISSTYTVDNENITITEAQINTVFVTATYDDWVQVINVSNASNQLLTVTTDYTVNLANGGVNISTNNTDDRTYYYVSYEFYDDDYVKSATSRALLPLILIFFALFLIGAAFMAVNWEMVKDWVGSKGSGKGRI